MPIPKLTLTLTSLDVLIAVREYLDALLILVLGNGKAEYMILLVIPLVGTRRRCVTNVAPILRVDDSETGWAGSV